ncbi:MAG: glycosyltransferase family 4 protein [Candidatus Aminicenantaceae bacterium]
MRIAFVTTEYMTEEEFDGGLSNYLNRTVQALKSRGHYIEVFTLSNNEQEISYQGVLVHQVKNQSFFFEFLNQLTRYRFKRTLRFLSLSYCLLRRVIKRSRIQNFDIIQASSCFACGLFLSVFQRIPIAVRVSSFEPLFRQYYRRPLSLDQHLCEFLESLTLRLSRSVYAPSRFLADILKKQKKIKAQVIRPPFFLNTSPWDESVYEKCLSGKKYFLFFGAIGYLKGGKILAQSLAEVLPKYPELYFAFAGKVLEGPNGLNMLEYIYKKAGKNKDRILYLGVLNHSQLYPVIKHSFSVVLPSLVDNFPNTMLEAMALEKVVIGTRGTSFEELIRPRLSGILIEPGNVKSLSDAIDKVWNMNEEDIKTMGQKAKNCISYLSPQITCLKLEQYFANIIKKGK